VSTLDGSVTLIFDFLTLDWPQTHRYFSN